MINKPYSKVTIELKNNFKIKEIKDILSIEGSTKIELIVEDDKKKALYSLKNNRKFDLKHFKALKDKDYVRKISF